ncbi:hypothetical protein OCU04_002857 [Sclerotinia nivalis]|uniref:Uncharacterized protein n=1 Tax=Sclerotinia nivalis TaxID=352851 RepID=A0A9X0AUH8_9HELO|nr:hypothetical protein OCU04_002857 [Sclerotinia nivalis]
MIFIVCSFCKYTVSFPSISKIPQRVCQIPGNDKPVYGMVTNLLHNFLSSQFPSSAPLPKSVPFKTPSPTTRPSSHLLPLHIPPNLTTPIQTLKSIKPKNNSP